MGSWDLVQDVVAKATTPRTDSSLCVLMMVSKPSERRANEYIVPWQTRINFLHERRKSSDVILSAAKNLNRLRMIRIRFDCCAGKGAQPRGLRLKRGAGGKPNRYELPGFFAARRMTDKPIVQHALSRWCKRLRNVSATKRRRSCDRRRNRSAQADPTGIRGCNGHRSSQHALRGL